MLFKNGQQYISSSVRKNKGPKIFLCLHKLKISIGASDARVVKVRLVLFTQLPEIRNEISIQSELV